MRSQHTDRYGKPQLGHPEGRSGMQVADSHWLHPWDGTMATAAASPDSW